MAGGARLVSSNVSLQSGQVNNFQRTRSKKVRIPFTIFFEGVYNLDVFVGQRICSKIMSIQS